MDLKCNKCHHAWEEDVEAGQPVVMCPECMAIVPMVLAHPSDPTPEPASDISQEPTVILPSPEAPAAEDQRIGTASEDIHDVATVREESFAEDLHEAPTLTDDSVADESEMPTLSEPIRMDNAPTLREPLRMPPEEEKSEPDGEDPTLPKGFSVPPSAYSSKPTPMQSAPSRHEPARSEDIVAETLEAEVNLSTEEVSIDTNDPAIPTIQEPGIGEDEKPDISGEVTIHEPITMDNAPTMIEPVRMPMEEKPEEKAPAPQNPIPTPDVAAPSAPADTAEDETVLAPPSDPADEVSESPTIHVPITMDNAPTMVDPVRMPVEEKKVPTAEPPAPAVPVDPAEDETMLAPTSSDPNATVRDDKLAEMPATSPEEDETILAPLNEEKTEIEVKGEPQRVHYNDLEPLRPSAPSSDHQPINDRSSTDETEAPTIPPPRPLGLTPPKPGPAIPPTKLFDTPKPIASPSPLSNEELPAFGSLTGQDEEPPVTIPIDRDKSRASGEEKTRKVFGKQASEVSGPVLDHSMSDSAAEQEHLETWPVPVKPEIPEDSMNETRVLPPDQRPSQESNQQVAPPRPSSSQQRRPAPTPTPPAKDRHGLVGRTVDGYRVEKLLGAGGMGAVYLAHQLSLDRKVALKILPAKFATNPDLLARFTREALSAAQLNHHNVIQVYDIGNVDNLHYIAMEYVRGESLGQIIRRDGRLQIDDAAGHILQAARGLHYAHERGIIHRDIKPDNIMVNEHGVVKIADMGLAKMLRVADDEERMGLDVDGDNELIHRKSSDLNLTQANVAMGTPAYMAPEQARDTASVDARADQYSLGCTLYYLCAGKAPYSGTTAFELMSKHLKEPLTPLDVHIKAVPPAFKKILEKMLAKDPDDRYGTLKDAGAEIESYLGIESDKGPYTPREQHLAQLEESVRSYYASPTLKKRKFAVMLFFLIMPVLLVLAILAKEFQIAGGILGLGVLTPLMGFLINGFLSRTYLFRRVRSVFFGMPWKNWLALVLGTGLGVYILYILGWLPWWIGFAIVAIGAAVAFQVMIVKKLKTEREPVVTEINEMLKSLRLRGVSEDALKDFLCRFSPGQHWEEFFEEFFTYEEMLLQRAKSAGMDRVKARKKFATWRDPIARWLDSIEEARKNAREKKQLAKVEGERLKAEGVNPREAEKQAEEAATRILKKGLITAVPDEFEVLKSQRRRLGVRFPWKPLFNLTRFALGVWMLVPIGVWIAVKLNLPVPDQLNTIMVDYDALGFGTKAIWSTLLAGVIVFLSSLSRRVLMPIVITLGALIFIFGKELVPLISEPTFTETVAFWSSLGLMAFGFVMCFLGKVATGKF